VPVYLARHGEHLAASEGRFGDEGLSEVGRMQARELGARLRDIPLRGCLVSPLKRAGETARIVLEGRDVPIEEIGDLAEGSVGALGGLDFEVARERYPDVFVNGIGVIERIAATGWTAPEGESRDAFVARAQRASSRIGRELVVDGDGLLVVAHGGLLNYLLQILLELPLRDEVPFGFPTAGAVTLGLREGAPGFGPFVSVWMGISAR